ncbi:MAG: serine/threonine protein kinase, partial [Planctomycetaceae bacterium]|nr:serine/threonine protein kinase [Planctomycetaceae bacterium]
KLGRRVALKVIRTGEFASTDEIRRFQMEAEAAAQLEHPGIVPIYDVGEEAGQHFFSMAYIEGPSLAGMLREHSFDPQRAALLVAQVADAVHYAHSRGVVHRDLKPGNVLMDPSGQPKVTDFGLAKRSDVDSQVTRTGEVMGTPSYMPPEQASGLIEQIGPLCDVYSLGGVLYALLTGRPPFQASNVVETLRQVLEQEPVSPRQLNAAVPADLETITLKCLQKPAASRYPSARELAEDLGRFLRDEPIEARPVSQLERGWRWCRRNPALAASGASVFVLVVVIAILMTVGYFRELESRRDSDHLRGLAEQALVDEQVQRRAAVRLQLESDSQRLATQKLLSESYVDRGRFICLQGEVAHGLLWMARGLVQLPAGESGSAELIRRRIGAWEPLLARRRATVMHGDKITHVRFSPDGAWFATGGQDGRVRLWDTQTGVELCGPLMHEQPVSAVTIRSDGRLMFTTSWDRQVRFWNVPEGTPAGDPIGQGRQIRAAAWSPNGEWFVAQTNDEKLHLWNARALKRMRGPLHSAPWTCQISFSSDSEYLAVAGGRRIRLMRLGEREFDTRVIDCPELTELRSVIFQPGVDRILVGGVAAGKRGAIRCYNVATGEPAGLSIDTASGAGVNDLAFSPDGEQLLAGTLSGTAERWSAATGESIGRPLHAGRPVRSVAWHPDGRRVLTGGDNGVATVWELPQYEGAELSVQHPRGAFAALFSPDDRMLVTGGRDNTVRRWNAFTGEPVGAPMQHDQLVMYVAISPDAQMLASGSADRTLRRWSLETGTPIGEPLRQPQP